MVFMLFAQTLGRQDVTSKEDQGLEFSSCLYTFALGTSTRPVSFP